MCTAPRSGKMHAGFKTSHLKGCGRRRLEGLRFMAESLQLQQEGQVKGKIAVMTYVSPKNPTMPFRPSHNKGFGRGIVWLQGVL